MEKLWEKIRLMNEGKLTLDDTDIDHIEYLEVVVDVQRIKREIELNKKIDIIRTQYEDSKSVEDYANKVTIEEKRKKVINSKNKRIKSSDELKKEYEKFEF
jgi:hypothetical protein